MAGKSKIMGIIGIIISAILVCAIVVTIVLSVTGYTFITQWWSGFSETGNSALPEDFTIDDALKESEEINIRTMNEGAVLLRNEDNALPLAKDTKVNLFGYYSAKTITNARGSVSVGSNVIDVVDMKTGFEKAGLKVNADLYKYTQDHAADEDNGSFLNMKTDYKINEINYGKLESAGMIANAKAYSDVAIYVMGRNAGEKADAPTTYDGMGQEGSHYLRATTDEIGIIENLREDFDKVIVILNNATTVEAGFLEEYDIDACIFMATPGIYGTISIGNIIVGEVNPSGHLATTYAYDVTDSPAYYTYGTNKYSNFSEWSDLSQWANKRVKTVDANLEHYYHYYEGIYVGYKYYETRYIGNDNVYSAEEEAAYQSAVQYPFGYGLSYSTFTWSDAKWTVGGKGGEIEVEVTVKNNGPKDGKDVVQLYYTAPYTAGGIEKSAVALAGFKKTGLIKSGETETVKLTVNFDELASYDYITEKCYVMDAGTYTLSLRSDAHTVESSLTKTFDVANKIVYKDSKDGKRSTDEIEAVNQFEEANKGDGSIKYVSRNDWAGTMPTQMDYEKSVQASASVVSAIKNETHGSYVDGPSKDEQHLANDAEWITTGAGNGLTVDDFAGFTDYDNNRWDDLLDQMTIEEMRVLYGDAAYRVASVKSIGMKRTVDADGPQGLNATTSGQFGTQFVSSTIMACTYDPELIEELGLCLGHEFLLAGVVGIYGPSINLHRSPFNGRNGEYMSEDSVLTGKIAAGYTRGAQKDGCYVYMKHYAAYGCAGNASSMVWLNEQGLRENYLRAFEICVKEADAKGMMVSFNRIGTSLNTCNYALLTTLPRGEWGFMGCFVSDGIGTSEWDCNLGIRAGLDLILDSSWDAQMVSWADATVDEKTTKSNYGQHCLRESAKRVIYRYCNSAASTVIRDWTPTWIWLIVALDAVLAGIAVVCFIFLIKPAFFPKKA